MGKQQTAIEWLEYQIIFNYNNKGMLSISDILLFSKQAKEIEKEQITNAWEDGKDSFSIRNSEKYYNETFKK